MYAVSSRGINTNPLDESSKVFFPLPRGKQTPQFFLLGLERRGGGGARSWNKRVRWRISFYSCVVWGRWETQHRVYKGSWGASTWRKSKTNPKGWATVFCNVFGYRQCCCTVSRTTRLYDPVAIKAIYRCHKMATLSFPSFPQSSYFILPILNAVNSVRAQERERERVKSEKQKEL